jgi:nucleotide-binding universal stress UspA family protein
MTVVVGVDGSPGSRVAADYALEEAALRGAELVFVTVVTMPEHWLAPTRSSATPPSQELVDGVRADIVALVDEVRLANPEAAGKVRIGTSVRVGDVGVELVEASEEASILVVGHRGRSRFSSAVLGSVGLYCVLHAKCTVTVVHP